MSKSACKAGKWLTLIFLSTLTPLAWGAESAPLAHAFLRPNDVRPAQETQLEILIIASSQTAIQQVTLSVPTGWTLTAPTQSSVMNGIVSARGATIRVSYSRPWARGDFDSILIHVKSPATLGDYPWSVKLNNSDVEPVVPKTKSLTVDVIESKNSDSRNLGK